MLGSIKAYSKVRQPTLPKYIRKIRSKWETVLSWLVMPRVKPTVAMAEPASKAAVKKEIPSYAEINSEEPRKRNK